MTLKRILIWMLVLGLATGIAACSAESPPVNPGPDEGADQPATEVVENAPLEEPTPAEDDNQDTAQESTPEVEPAVPDFDPLPPDPQPVTFETEDGRTLEGLYYPAKVANAPVVVLMHWAPGTMDDWVKIAPWLQNRQDELALTPTGKPVSGLLRLLPPADYRDDSWFPEMPEDISFAVVAFNFGGYGSSQYGGSRTSYLEDAVSALRFAASLDAVDPHRVLAIGASIGADGVVDGCYLFNDAGESGTCIGALSLSPGNYLTDDFTYAEAGEAVDLEGYPVWCLAADKDYESPEVCLSLSGENSRAFIFPGSAHGMDLVSPEARPDSPAVDLNTMQLIQEFLEQALGITLNEVSL